MKRLIALFAMAFFGVTATCGMGFAAEKRPPMSSEQAGQAPAHPQKRPPHPNVKKQDGKAHGKDRQHAAPSRPSQKKDGNHRPPKNGDHRPPAPGRPEPVQR